MEENKECLLDIIIQTKNHLEWFTWRILLETLLKYILIHMKLLIANSNFKI